MTSKQEREFVETINSLTEVKISDSALDYAIEYIGGNLEPDDVFSTKQLEEWAGKNGYTKE